MIDIDLNKTGSTLHMWCGTTNVGHYAFIQQGIHNAVEHAVSRQIYEILVKLAPTPPGEKWEPVAIELRDYRPYNKFHKVYATFKFKREGEEWSKEVDLDPATVEEVYGIFRRGTLGLLSEKPTAGNEFA